MELVDFLRQRGVATYKLPERLEILDELPLTRNLKVMKETLRADIARKLEGERALGGRANAD